MKKLYLASISLLILGTLGFYGDIFVPLAKGNPVSKIFIIQKGEGSREIAYHLERQGFIRSAPVFRIFVLTFGLSNQLKAGAYSLNPAMTAAKIANMFVEGNVVREFFTILEGWNIQDIANALEKQGQFSKQDFLNITKKDFSPQFDFLRDKLPSATLEGYLFPDTYQISRTQSLPDFVDKILANFGRHYTQNLRDETKKQRKTIFEVITMASLLEREVQTAEDKKFVAGILWKRLSIGMPLQVDAAPETYKAKGLPAGPIASPGIDSILAALYPTKSSYMYYLSTSAGKTIFSKTLEDHNAARAKYLINLR